jgi:hypothetical protein
VSRLGEVVGERLGEEVGAPGPARLEGEGDALVVVAATCVQQRRVGRLLDERMLEDVRVVVRRGEPMDEADRRQVRQCPAE